MTRIFTDGAETGDNLFFDLRSTSATTSQKRSGNYSYGSYYGEKNINGISEMYFRIAVREGSMGEAGIGTCFLPRYYNSSTTHAQLYFGGDYKLHIDAGGSSNVATGSRVFNNNVWYLIEEYLKIDDSPNGRFIVKVDGIIDIDYTGDTKNGSTTTVNMLRIGTAGYNEMYFDDIALNDTDGTIDNSWCGDGHVEFLSPNGNGDTNDWTNSSGNKTNNYTYVDEIPYNEDTDYVSASVVGIQDMYNVGTFTYTNRIIKRVWSRSISKDVSYTEKGIKIGYKTGGNVYLSASTVLSGAYTAVSGSVAVVNPSTGLEWTGVDIDSIQFVQESA